MWSNSLKHALTGVPFCVGTECRLCFSPKCLLQGSLEIAAGLVGEMRRSYYFICLRVPRIFQKPDVLSSSDICYYLKNSSWGCCDDRIQMGLQEDVAIKSWRMMTTLWRLSSYVVMRAFRCSFYKCNSQSWVGPDISMRSTLTRQDEGSLQGESVLQAGQS